METTTKLGWNDMVAAGILVDLTEEARELGIKVKVGVSRAAYDSVCAKTPDDELFPSSSESIRRAALAFALNSAAGRHCKEDGNVLPFQVRVVKRIAGDRRAPLMVPLKCKLDIADDGKPCAVVKLSEEP